MSNRISIGVLATEFPPDVGGMPEHARGLTTALAQRCQLTVFTRPGQGLEQASFDQKPILSGASWLDLPLLASARMDAWLGLNGGLSPLIARLDSPAYLYLHGNDFLNPWLACGPKWLELIQRPYAAIIRRRLRRCSIRNSIDRCNLVFCNSHRTAELIRQTLRVNMANIRVVPPGVGNSFFSVAHTPSRAALRVLTVANLSSSVRRKNVDGVLKALRLLRDKLELRYTIVGDGDDRARLQRLAIELGLGHRVRFLGRVSAKGLLQAYSEADLFILASSATDRDIEGFGIVFLEASAAGLPVICSRAGGSTDAVEDGVNGLIIDDSSPDAIAAGIEDFLRRRADFDPNQIRTFAERFRWETIAARLLGEIRGDPSQEAVIS